MSASHSEPMGAHGWEPDFSIIDDVRALQSEIDSTRNAFWNAWRQGRTIPQASRDELTALENRLEQLRKARP